MLPKVKETAREECSISELVLGVKCGSSDGFSGISANPSLRPGSGPAGSLRRHSFNY
jgi:altronate dehydratase